MKYEICKEPYTHIIIDDWLPEEVNNEFLSEIKTLLPYMQPGKIGSDQIGNLVNPDIKYSLNLWLFQHYFKYQKDNNIAFQFEKRIWSPEVKNIFKETGDALFVSMLYTNISQLLLSRYPEGGHYAWHKDYFYGVTINYMLGHEPLKFKGGDFVFGGWESKEDLKVVPFKNNRLIAFPGRAYHKVTPVTDHTGEPIDSRFTLQYWSRMKERQEA